MYNLENNREFFHRTFENIAHLFGLEGRDPDDFLLPVQSAIDEDAAFADDGIEYNPVSREIIVYKKKVDPFPRGKEIGKCLHHKVNPLEAIRNFDLAKKRVGPEREKIAIDKQREAGDLLHQTIGAYAGLVCHRREKESVLTEAVARDTYDFEELESVGLWAAARLCGLPNNGEDVFSELVRMTAANAHALLLEKGINLEQRLCIEREQEREEMDEQGRDDFIG